MHALQWLPTHPPHPHPPTPPPPPNVLHYSSWLSRSMACLYIFLSVIALASIGRCVSLVNNDTRFIKSTDSSYLFCISIPNVRSKIECAKEGIQHPEYDFGFSFRSSSCVICRGVGTFPFYPLQERQMNDVFLINGRWCRYKTNTITVTS